MKQANKMKLSLVAGLLLSGISGFAAAADKDAGGISDGAVKIGVLTDMSGLYADLGGRGSVEAAKMAVEDFGGKVLGKPIEVLSADHQNKADIGANIAREWYDRQGVDMITDAMNSAVALATAKLTAEKKRILIANGAGSTKLTNEECTPYTVHYAYDTYAMAKGTAGTVAKQGGKSWYFLTADYAFGQSLQADAAKAVKAAGGEVLGEVKHPLNAADFSSFILQAQSSKAKVVGLADAGGDIVNAIKAANEFGLTKDQTLAGLLVMITDVNSLGLPTAQGLLLTEGWYWDLNDETRKFGKRFFEKMKKMPTMVQAGVYSATTTYLKAIQAAGTDNADAVMAEMKKTKINDMFAKNGYIRQDGRMVHDMYLMQVKKPAESKYPWDYYNVKATIPGDEAYQPMSESRCAFAKKS
jgi:branched-chain amino acid transport system substrate-binding protein